MKDKQFKLTNPTCYTNDFTIRGIMFKAKIENPNGLNAQKITIQLKKQKKNEFETLYELTEGQMEIIKKYLKDEGFLQEAREHNLYFE
jgi:hypothetical protein